MVKYRPAQDIRQLVSITLRYRILILWLTTIVTELAVTISFADMGQIAAGIEDATEVYVSV